MKPLRVAVLASGQGTNLQALIDAIDARRVRARICCVVSDTRESGALKIAVAKGLPAHFVDPSTTVDRAAFGQALHDALLFRGAGLVLLAGFMRVLDSGFVQRWQGRMLNIHPSLLPAYRGLDAHTRALAAGDTEHGASVHFVTEELDAGPVVIQAVVPVHEVDDEDSLMQRVQEQEHRIYPWCAARFAEGRLDMADGRARYDGRVLDEPLRVRADTDLDAL